MRFASLGSGSEGNAWLIEAGSGATRTRVLLDCGFGQRETAKRLERLGCVPQQLDAVLVTHEHGDHIGSAYGFCARHCLPLYMSHGTWFATRRRAGTLQSAEIDIRLCVAEQGFAVGDLCMHPYTVPHDAREPLQFVFDDGAKRLGILTDAGCATPNLLCALRGLHALVLECNHDRDLLKASAYPAALKARIAGDYGHLANDAAAEILADIAHADLSVVVAAHLSQQNNTRQLATAALANVLARDEEEILVADQREGLNWQSL